MMEFVLNILLNYITLGVAGVAFILLLVVLIWKRKNLSAKEKSAYRAVKSFPFQAVPVRNLQLNA